MSASSVRRPEGRLRDGDGLLFLHGAGSRAIVWQLQMLAFPRARAADLPGRDGHPPGDVDGYLAALRAAADARPRVVAGHSLGGAIALRWALESPQDLEGIVLVGTGARLRVAPRWLEGIAAGDRAALEEFGDAWFAPGADARLREKSLALLRQMPFAVVAADLRAADRFDVTGELDRIRLPVLILCGSEDRLTPVKYSRFLHERLPDSRLVVIEGAGHLVMVERPRETNEAIGAWLADLETAQTGRAR